VTWEVQIAKSGEYAVGLCHAANPVPQDRNSRSRAGGTA